MKYTTIPILLILISVSGCAVVTNPDDTTLDALLGEWYKIEPTEARIPSPDMSVRGWSISDESKWNKDAIGSLGPIGIEGNSGTISLIEPPFRPSFLPEILAIKSDIIIMEYYGYLSLASKNIPGDILFDQAVADLYISIDTVQYSISSDRLTLNGRHYKGTFKRTGLGEKVTEPLKSNFTVTVDDRKINNLEIAETVPTAYISKLSSNHIRLHSRMGGQNITIDISDYAGPGTYIIGRQQAVYSRFGLDTLSPSYITVSDSSGFITIESDGNDNKRYSGYFEFSAYTDGEEQNPELLVIHFTDGIFDLPVYR